MIGGYTDSERYETVDNSVHHSRVIRDSWNALQPTQDQEQNQHMVHIKAIGYCAAIIDEST